MYHNNVHVIHFYSLPVGLYFSQDAQIPPTNVIDSQYIWSIVEMSEETPCY
jgi:hypothetical protein